MAGGGGWLTATAGGLSSPRESHSSPENFSAVLWGPASHCGGRGGGGGSKPTGNDAHCTWRFGDILTVANKHLEHKVTFIQILKIKEKQWEHMPHFGQ